MGQKEQKEQDKTICPLPGCRLLFVVPLFALPLRLPLIWDAPYPVPISGLFSSSPLPFPTPCPTPLSTALSIILLSDPKNKNRTDGTNGSGTVGTGSGGRRQCALFIHLVIHALGRWHGLFAGSSTCHHATPPLAWAEKKTHLTSPFLPCTFCILFYAHAPHHSLSHSSTSLKHLIANTLLFMLHCTLPPSGTDKTSL